METKNREKLFLIIICVCVGLWVLDKVVISPMSDSWSARHDKIAKTRNQIQEGKDLMERGPDIKKHWDEMSRNALPGNVTLAESALFTHFDQWGRSSGVTLVGQKPEIKDSDDPTYQNMEWRADVTGSEAQIAQFIYYVESSPMALKVESVEMSSRDDYGRQLALGLTVSGLVLTPTNNVAQ